MLVAAASARYAVSRKGIPGSHNRIRTGLKAYERCDRGREAARWCGGDRAWWQDRLRRAYGSRKLAGEPGLDGSPAPAEPMTEDTIFDIASLTKSLATATAVMQLYEHGEVQFDDPVQKYLPEFNTANDPRRALVTVRLLLTHTSGEPIDVNLQDPWGLEASR